MFNLAQLQDIGYDSFNMYMNLGTISVFLALYLIKFALVIILKPLSMISATAKKYYNKFFYAVFFTDLILIYSEGYMEFLISSVLLFQAPNQSVDKIDPNINFAYICVGICVVFFPFLHLRLMFKSL